MKRTFLFILFLAAVALPGLNVAQPTLASKSAAFPEIISLPDGFRPEGIVSGRPPNAYVGSLANGAIYHFNLLTGEGAILAPGQDGRVAVGLGYDKRTDYLFVSGGPTGTASVYDATSGAEVAVYQLTTTSPTFVNDVIVTRQAAYFTDSSQPVYYRLPLGPGGSLPEPTAVETIALSGDFVFVPGAFNSNGIEATPGGRWLLIVHSARGELYRVDPATGEATLVDLGGGALPNGDGLWLEGHTLYVVQNFLNQIAVVQLNSQYDAGTITDVITHPDFRIPTTVTGVGPYLFAVNARFDTPPTPDTEYEVVRVNK
ncbi:MAG: superoxide dismutase [Anaerolineae bacterium]|nr:superoxide dismutase [Anaerolineae bacterium]